MQRTFSLFWCLCLLSGLGTCNPFPSPNEAFSFDADAKLQSRQDRSIFSVLGVAGLGNTTVVPRREIRDLEFNYPDVWNVYLLGLQRFQNVSQDDKLSYYKIAGIHGRPWEPWDAAPDEPTSSYPYIGYCTHSSNLFPTWHRPYMALFEEALYLNARQAVSQLANSTLKTRYMEALKQLRIPYWDWAAVPPDGKGSLPWSMARPTINIVLPDGNQTIRNPLYSYTFHPLPDWQWEGAQKWHNWRSTIREATSEDANATSQNNIVARNFDGNRQNLQSRVYNLLAFQKNYNMMSNKLIAQDSLESIHGVIHDTLGGDAYMTWLQYSAFDPAFWLHHANVDRLLAIWQELNPNSWVEPMSNPDPTYAIPAGANGTAQSDLTPFHKDDSGNFWNSDDIRAWQRFGYTYPDLEGLTNSSTIVSRVNALYGPQATALLSNSNSKRDVATSGAPSFSGKRQYTVNIKMREFGFSGAVKIFVFLDEPKNNDTKNWVDAQGFVGVTSVLAAARQGLQEANTIVPLTAALEAKVHIWELGSMEEDCVADYLKEKMRWKIVQSDGTPIRCETIPGLQVLVTWQEILPSPSADEFPCPVGDIKDLLISDGKLGHF